MDATSLLLYSLCSLFIPASLCLPHPSLHHPSLSVTSIANPGGFPSFVITLALLAPLNSGVLSIFEMPLPFLSLPVPQPPFIFGSSNHPPSECGCHILVCPQLSPLLQIFCQWRDHWLLCGHPHPLPVFWLPNLVAFGELPLLLYASPCGLQGVFTSSQEMAIWPNSMDPFTGLWILKGVGKVVGTDSS